MGMPEPAIVRALGGRLWSLLVAAVAALGMTAVFGVLMDAGWGVAQGFLGAVLAAALLALGGILVQQRLRTEGSL